MGSKLTAARHQRLRLLYGSRWPRSIASALALSLLITCVSSKAESSTAEAEEFDPVRNFSALPPIRQIALSPDGKMAVVLRPVGDTYHAATLNLENGASKVIMAADPEQFLFNWCRFANNKRIVCSIRSYIVPQASAANLTNIVGYRAGRIVATRLLAVNVDGSKQIQLVKNNRTSVGQKLQWIDQRQDDIVNWLVDEPNHVLIALSREHRSYPSVYRLNINNNRMKKVQSFRKGIYQWGTNRRGEIIHAFGFGADDKAQAFFVGDGSNTELDLSHLNGEQGIAPLAYSVTGDTVYVLANAGNDTLSVVEVDSKTAEINRSFVGTAGFDASGLLTNTLTGKALASVEYTDQLNYRWLDSELEKQYELVKSRLPGETDVLRIAASDASLTKLVFYASGSATHPAYFLYDRKKRSLTKLATSYPSVPNDRISPTEYVSFKARDGLDVPAYLTLPAHLDSKNLPTIILPHGGPYSRDRGGFDYWSQFLASLGYAVLQPNFRGSSGYGDEYLSRGFKQWGLSMQDDLDDGLDWMIKQGYSDPKRVCMLGGSYGGYAALVASFKSAAKYQCAITFAGVTDLDRLVDRWVLSYGLTSAAQRIQRGSLRDRYSPLQRAKDIEIPLLVIHGDVDERVPVGHSRALVAALAKLEKTHTYVELANGDHHLSLQSHRAAFFGAVAEFLEKHIGKPISN